MTLTFSQENDRELLLKYQSSPIETEEENDRALKLVEELMNLPSRTPEQEEIYKLLIESIEKFEREFYQVDRPSNLTSMLLFLMEQQDIKPQDLVEICGSDRLVDDLINGRAIIDNSLGQRLGKFFNVDASVFDE